MIGQRLAVLGTAALPAARNRNRQGPVAAHAEAVERHAIAGREHLIGFLRRSVLLQLMLAMALISMAALIYLNQASKQSLLEFNITDLQRQQIQLNLQNANLYATATSLQSLARIENLASTQLQMAQPTQNSSTWISPTFYRVAPLALAGDAASVQRQSQPLAWMEHAVQFISTQL